MSRRFLIRPKQTFQSGMITGSPFNGVFWASLRAGWRGTPLAPHIDEESVSVATIMPYHNSSETRLRRLSDLLNGDDQPLSTSELAQMIGMSQTFVREEIRAGHLRAVSVGHG